MSLGDTVSDIPGLIDKDVVRESLSKMENRIAAGPTSVLSKMVKAEVEAAGVDMITDLINQIIEEGELFQQNRTLVLL